MLAGTERGRTLPAAAVASRAALAIVAAAALAVLAIGLAGHTTHDEMLGHNHVPQPATLAALIGGWLLMVAAMMLPPELVTGGRGGAPPRTNTGVPSGPGTGVQGEAGSVPDEPRRPGRRDEIGAHPNPALSSRAASGCAARGRPHRAAPRPLSRAGFTFR